MFVSRRMGTGKNQRNTKIAALFLAALVAGVAFSGAPAQGNDYSFAPLQYPGSTNTWINGAAGSTLYGNYTGASGSHGFSYQNGTFTPLDVPGATGGTQPFTASGSTVAGLYNNATGAHGFTLNNDNYTPFDVAGAYNTWVDGISGSTLIGNYSSSLGTRGFIYQNGNLITLNYPTATSGTGIYGIWGSTVVGTFSNASGSHAFTYDNGFYSAAWEVPGSIAGHTEAWGISGSIVVGCYNNTAFPDISTGAHGFIKDGNVFTTVDYPGALGTRVVGFSDNGLVGYYRDSNNVIRGFVATPVPEPASLALLSLASAALLIRRCR